MEDGSCGSGASRSDSLHKGACSLDEGAEEGEERV